MFLWTVLLIVLMSAIAYVAGRSRATGLVVADGPRLHSLPSYHGLLVAAGAMAGGLALAILSALVLGTQSVVTPAAAVVGAHVQAGDEPLGEHRGLRAIGEAHALPAAGEEVLQDAQTGRVALLRMELGGHQLGALDRAGRGTADLRGQPGGARVSLQASIRPGHCSGGR